MHHQLMAAVFVRKALDDDRAFVGQRAGHSDLSRDEIRRALCGRLVKAHTRKRLLRATVRVRLPQRAHHAPECKARLECAPLELAVPEGNTAVGSVGGREDHAVLVDAQHAPAERAEQEAIADIRFIHEFLVEFPDLHARFRLGGIRTLVGNRSDRRHGEHAAVRIAPHAFLQRIIQNARPRGHVASMLFLAREHSQTRLDFLARHLRKRIRAREQRHHVIHGIFFCRGHGNQVLAEHIQAPARRLGLLHAALARGLRGHAALNRFQLRARIHLHHAHAAGMVACTPQTLHRARHRARAADLKHLVDIAHVDAQLHRGGGAQKAQFALAQRILGFLPLLLGKAAVMHAREILSAELIDVIGELFRVPARLAKRDDAVRALAARVHGLGDLLPHVPVFARAQARHAANGKGDLLLHLRRDDRRASGRKKLRGQRQRLDRRGKSHALNAAAAEAFQPREGEHQMRAALGIDERVQLVDDHCARRAQNALSASAGEHEVERFGRSDEDMRRLSHHARALRLWGITRAHLCADGVRVLDALQRPAQVFADIRSEGFEWRDIDHLCFIAERTCPRRLRKLIDKREESRQRLARTGRRAHEHVLTRGDPRPCERLNGGRRSHVRVEKACRFRRKHA